MNQEEDILELSESKEIDCILNQKGNIEQNKMKIEEDNTKKFKFNLTVKDTLKTSLNNFLIKLESIDRKLNNIRMNLIGKNNSINSNNLIKNNLIKSNSINNNNLIKNSKLIDSLPKYKYIKSSMKSYDEFNGPVNHFIKNNSTAPIHIKFKHGSYEKVYFVYDTDTTDKLYDSILGTTSNEDLIFEDMKLPRGLTIEEAGFFPGMNYVTVKNINPKFLVEKEFFIRLNFIYTDSIDLRIKEDATVDSICKMYGEKYILIKNGSYLDMSFKIKDVFNCGECVDLVERSLCE